MASDCYPRREINQSKFGKLPLGEVECVSCFIFYIDSFFNIRSMYVEFRFCQATVVGHAEWVRCICVSPDASVFFSGSSDHVRFSVALIMFFDAIIVVAHSLCFFYISRCVLGSWTLRRALQRWVIGALMNTSSNASQRTSVAGRAAAWRDLLLFLEIVFL